VLLRSGSKQERPGGGLKFTEICKKNVYIFLAKGGAMSIPPYRKINESNEKEELRDALVELYYAAYDLLSRHHLPHHQARAALYRAEEVIKATKENDQ
jgi:hypothetical protein